ncbi:hypothetical protein GCM10025880_54150 [Methylorubrum aminovorans]|nr:hypothetical protein GCM10025880_54150 [Methylorubrum aminovorans]
MFRSERSAPPRLVVAGGGPAGWMAAFYLKRVLRRAGWSVTLVGAAPAAGTPVALATRPSFTRFLNGFNIDEAIFMRRCAATYRLASRYDDWFAEGEGHWHPFGACGPRIAGRDLFHYWMKLRGAGAEDEAGSYSDYAPQALMAAAGRGPRPEAERSSLTESGEYGYHLDRAALVRFLRELALAEGVRAVSGRVRGIERDLYGDVAALVLDAGQTVEGDIFLDCTGAASQLIGTALGEAWNAGSGPGDRLVRLSRPRLPEAPPFTAYRGRAEGWTASLPLADRTEHHFVYDSRTTPPEAAAEILHRAVDGEGDLAHAELRYGRRAAPWQRNVVAIGAAAGAVEPLVGFDLDLVLAGLEAFLAYLPRQGRGRRAPPRLQRAAEPLPRRCRRGGCRALRPRSAAGPVLGECPRRNDPRPARRPARPLRIGWSRRPERGGAVCRGDHYLLFSGAEFLPRRPFAPVDVADGREVARLLASIRAQSGRVAQAMAPHARLIEALHGPAPAAAAAIRVAAAEAPAGPASLRGTPAGARLADLVAGLGQPFGYERSVKATPAGLQTERFLVSLHRTSLGLAPGKTLDHLAARLGLPERERAEAADLIADADILHLGYEDGPSGALYKLYVEWSSRTDATWSGADETGAETMLVHRAYKWRPEGGHPPIVTLYHWPQVRSPEDIEARLSRIADAWGAAGTPVLDTARAILRLARERGRGFVHYLEAREEPGQRLSYDLNLYACGLSVADAEPLLGQAFVDLGIPPQAAAAVLAERLRESLGHVAGGVGRDGQPFLTVYSGKAGA